jgi:hypothetical protein
MGLSPHPGSTCESRIRLRPDYGGQHTKEKWFGACPGTQPPNHLEEFLRRHWDQIVAADYFTIEVWTSNGLQRFAVLFFLELSTGRVEVAGIAATPNGLWMTQIARNLTDGVDGFFIGKRYLIHDRDPLYTNEFLNMLGDVGFNR